MAPIKTNNPYASYFDFFSRTGTDAVNSAPVSTPGLTATGGVISDYESSGTYYRAHIFTNSGTFDVETIGDAPATVEYVVVAGGGGGGLGGGGAGGYRSSVTGENSGGGGSAETALTVSATSYTISVGAGGVGANTWPTAIGSDGVDSSISGPDITTVTSTKGGGGGGNGSHGNGRPGGSGGGSGNQPYTVGAGTANQGYAGGDSRPAAYSGGGGGGAGGVGGNAPSNPVGGVGGIGLRTTIAGPSYPIGTDGPGPTTGGWLSGGGGGQAYPGAPVTAGSGGAGGGGTGSTGPTANLSSATSGQASTGGGGGGAYLGNSSNGPGGSGGSGIVIVRYQIDSSQSGSAKASGGSISYYGSKTIHAFTSSGNFVAPATFNETVEYVVVGGGGAGGGPSAPGVNSYYGGGGGAGAYRKGSTPISTPQTISIQIGAGGAKGALLPSAGSPSYFGTPITSPGGGYGATWQDPGGQPTVGGGPGASSGGSSYGGSVASNTGTSFTASPKDATANTPTNGWGHGGGTGHPTGDSGGGGGAGGAGQNAADSAAGDGGLGMQLPTTFRDPASTVGAPGPTNTSSHNPGWTNVDDSGKYWVAGGGGGSAYGPDSGHTSGVGGVGSPPVGSSPFAGAGNGSRLMAGGTAALQNTGSGGGGMERATPNPSPQPDAGNGGSGLVLIAYPT